MSDENLNSNGNEETAALFVSAQKKKKAEEEARRKAEEEQAKREAAEAEVRRMEQEVEARKRKAEEERLALEEAEKNRQAEMQRLKVEKEKEAARIEAEARAKARAKAKAKDERAAAVANGASSIADKLKNPKILAAIIGAVVVIIALIVVLVVVNGGKGEDKTADEDRKSRKEKIEEEEEEEEEPAASTGEWVEYTPSSPKHQVRISYPSDIYPDGPVEGNAVQGTGINLYFTPADENNPYLDVLLEELFVIKNGTSLTKGLLGFVASQTFLDSYVEDIQRKLRDQYGDVEFLETQNAQITEEGEMYYASGMMQISEEETGIYSAFLEPDNTGDYKSVTYVFRYHDGPDPNLDMMEEFARANMNDPLYIPGGDPPKSTELDDVLACDICHLGIPAPAGEFDRNMVIANSDFSYMMWSDRNGASIIVKPFLLNGVSGQDVINALSEKTQDGVATYLSDGGVSVNERTVLNEAIDEESYKCYIEAEETIGGIAYWEKIYGSLWNDLQTDQQYLVFIYYLAPAANKDVYENMYMKAVVDLRDI